VTQSGTRFSRRQLPLREIAQILAAGMLRVLSRTLCDPSNSIREVRLDFSPTQSVHGPENREGGK
jgi:hypothetical protein